MDNTETQITLETEKLSKNKDQFLAMEINNLAMGKIPLN